MPLIDPILLRAASLLAREAAYRAGRERGRRRFLGWSATMKYNLLLIIFFTIFSASVGFSAFAGREVVASILSSFFLFQIVMGLFTMAFNLQAINAHRLLDPMLMLPLDRERVRIVLTLISLHWGGIALPFLVLPGSVVAAQILSDPLFLIGGLLLSIFGTLLAISLGYFVGSFLTGYTRSLRARAMSTILWVVLLTFSFTFGQVISRTARFIKTFDPEALSILPPLSFLYAPYRFDSLAISLASLAAVGLFWRYSISRYWARIFTGTVPAPPPPSEWRIFSGMRAALMREVKVLARTPRFLASMIVYSLVFPIMPLFFALPRAEEAAEALAELSSVLPAFAFAMGGLAGFSVMYLFSTESSGARALYQLPLSRAGLTTIKAATFLLLNAATVAIYAAVITLLVGPDLLTISVFLLSFAGSSLLNSSLYSAILPKEPSDWSPETFGRTKLGIIFLLQVIAYMAVMFLSILGMGLGSAPPLAVLAVGLATQYSAVALLYKLNRRPL